MDIKYAYLTFCLLFFMPWAVLFYGRKELRREMLVMGIIGAIGSFVTAYFWTIDWWRPQTITGTRMAPEDLLVGFSNAGIAAVLYLEFFRRRVYRKSQQPWHVPLLLLVIATCGIFAVAFYAFGLKSFYACAVALCGFSASMLLFRRELFLPSLINGLLMVVISVPIYLITILLYPNFVYATYTYPLAVPFRIFTVPIQEFIFYFALAIWYRSCTSTTAVCGYAEFRREN